MFELNDGEKLIADKAANAKKGFEYVGGRLAVTNERIVHVPHKMNIQSGMISITIPEIQFVTTYNQFGILPTGILLKTKSGDEYRFVVWGRMKLIHAINELT